MTPSAQRPASARAVRLPAALDLARWTGAQSARALRLVQHGPRLVLDVGAAAGSWVLGRRPNGPMRQWQRNVEIATGRRPDTRLTQAAAASWARTMLDSARLADWPAQRVADAVSIAPADWARLRDAFHTTGAVLALPHLGSWDLAGTWVGQRGLPVTSVAEDMDPAEYRFFVEARERMGMRIHAHTDALLGDKLLADQRAGRMVCLLMDRDLSRWGTRVHWPTPSGPRTVRVPNGAARIAVQTGSTLFAVTTHYTRAGLHIEISEPITAAPGTGQVRAMCQQVVEVFAAAIAEHPADWHMLVPFFPDEAPSPIPDEAPSPIPSGFRDRADTAGRATHGAGPMSGTVDDDVAEQGTTRRGGA